MKMREIKKTDRIIGLGSACKRSPRAFVTGFPDEEASCLADSSTGRALSAQYMSKAQADNSNQSPQTAVSVAAREATTANATVATVNNGR